jgi:hypothetical protein
VVDNEEVLINVEEDREEVQVVVEVVQAAREEG